MKNCALDFYLSAKERGESPVIFESLGIASPFNRLQIAASKPKATLEVWEGVAYLNNKRIGCAKAIFDYLCFQDQHTNFFPAWFGFFTYEFARHFGYKTHRPLEGMPEAAFYLYDDGIINTHQSPFPDQIARNSQQQNILSSFTQEEFQSAVATIQESIRLGNVYQVNLSRRFCIEAPTISPLDLYLRLRENNPSPFMGLIERNEYAICSASPERLFNVDKNIISARPIAGTRKRGKTLAEDDYYEQELRQSPKEQAEHIMLADLLRNDISQCSEAGSVQVTEAMSVERYAHVMHLVSEITGESKASFQDMTRCIFPGGTITGAPKKSVMQTIGDLEPVPRGPYTGSMGYVSANKRSDFNILIRSPYFVGDKLFFSTGAGIVIDSNPEAEFKETENKAGSFYDALDNTSSGSKLQKVKKFASWKPPKPQLKKHCDIAFIENNDSFSHNIINYLQTLGASVHTFNHQNFLQASKACTHVVIGPGPGMPVDYGNFNKVLTYASKQSIPLLGVCLGHQAIGHFFGAKVTPAPSPIHGEAHAIKIDNQSSLFANMPTTCLFTRYHSLVLTDLPQCLRVIAKANSDLVMGIEHLTLPIYGVQFHPESFISEQGMTLLENFLNVT